MATQSQTRSGERGSQKGVSMGVPGRSVFKRQAQGPSISLADVTPDLVVSALDAALNAGVLISLGRTSDGGAIGVYVTSDGNREKAWGSSAEELEELFEDLRDAYPQEL